MQETGTLLHPPRHDMKTYLILFLIAAACNIAADDWRGMLMCAVVGFGISVPIPDHNFYAWCALVELVVIIGALWLRTPSSLPVYAISLCLMVMHYLGYKLNGYLPESPYHILVKIAEHAELVACILFSQLILGFRECRHQNSSRIG